MNLSRLLGVGIGLPRRPRTHQIPRETAGARAKMSLVTGKGKRLGRLGQRGGRDGRERGQAVSPTLESAVTRFPHREAPICLTLIRSGFGISAF